MAEALAYINTPEQAITTIAGLPASPQPYQRGWVSNGLLTTGWGVAVGATGAATLPVWYDATTTTWRYG